MKWIVLSIALGSIVGAAIIGALLVLEAVDRAEAAR